MYTRMATIRIGCNFMPISVRNLTNAEEVVHMTKTGLQVAQDTSLVVIAQDEQVALAVDKLGVFADALKLIVGTQQSCQGWTPFDSMMDGQLSSADPVELPPPSEKGGTVMFTSGTTSLPKAILQPYSACLAWPVVLRPRAEKCGNWGPGKKICCSMPNNHAMGYVATVGMLMSGTALVFAGHAFDPTLMLDTLFGERATHGMFVPTMIHALAAVKAASPQYSSRPLSDIENVLLGGASCTTEHTRLLLKELGVQGVENFYGCTEGLLTSSQRATDSSKIADGNEISAGWPMSGYRVKLVDPETGKVVPRNTLGEVHGTGYGVIGPYIGGVGADSWYTDAEGIGWYKTGDQARMDDQGRLFITGRYKDMYVLP